MPEDTLAILGQRVRAARIVRGLSQERLSDISGVSLKHIANIEKAKCNPSIEKLVMVARALGVSLDALLNPPSEQEKRDIQEITDLYVSCSKEKQRILLATVRTLGSELLEARIGDEAGKDNNASALG